MEKDKTKNTADTADTADTAQTADTRLTAYLNYFESLATQPANRWDGFYTTPYEERQLALRFQIAFACMALGALCLRFDGNTQAQDRCRAAMVLLIERMMQRRVWAYWAIEAERHGLSPDPIKKGNIQYSGLLASMIGVFEAVGGDNRYDENFTLLWTSNEQFEYSHHTLVETIWNQMDYNSHNGVESEPGRVYTSHMNGALLANALHDALHGSQYATANADWLDFVQRRLLLHGPRLAGRGVFGTVYMTATRLPVTVGLNFVDAWTLAFLAVLEPDLARKHSARFLRGVRYQSGSPSPEATPTTTSTTTDTQAYVPTASVWQSREQADLALTNGFAYLLAVHLDDTELADALLNYADATLQPVEVEGKRHYDKSLAVPFATALFALGEAGGLIGVYREAQRLTPPPIPGQEQEEPEPETEPSAGTMSTMSTSPAVKKPAGADTDTDTDTKANTADEAEERG